jgi:hypothetical protein
MTTHPMDLATHISAAYQQFAAVRQRFEQPGTERGGCPRDGVTPVYVRKFGDHAATIFLNLATVEASFDANQLRAITATLLVLKGWITGRAAPVPLAERIIDAYLSDTRPYFVPALLRATEATLTDFLGAHPDHAPVLDAIFCVAGGEGFRDLVRLYDARALEHASHYHRRQIARQAVQPRRAPQRHLPPNCRSKPDQGAASRPCDRRLPHPRAGRLGRDRDDRPTIVESSSVFAAAVEASQGARRSELPADWH